MTSLTRRNVNFVRRSIIFDSPLVTYVALHYIGCVSEIGSLPIADFRPEGRSSLPTPALLALTSILEKNDGCCHQNGHSIYHCF